MTHTPPARGHTPLPVISVFSEWSGFIASAGPGTPSSGTWGTAGSAIFFPLYLPAPFVVSKAWWLNGATVGTDSIDLGVYRMTDPATGRCDLVRSTGAVLSAGSANVLQTASAWKVARTNLLAAGDSTDQDTYTTASVTLKASRLYCLAVENSHASSAPAVSSVTGGGTWTSRASTQFNSSANRISLWTCVPTVDYTGTLAIAFGASSGVTGAVWALDEMSGVDTSTNDGIVQTATGTGSSVTPAATLAAFGSADNATYGVHGKAANATSTAGSGFTELSDTGTATPAQSISTEWRVDNDTSVDFTISSAAWGCIAAEVKADSSPFVIPPAMPGAPSVYLAMSISGTTATVFRNAPSQNLLRGSGALSVASTFPLPSTATPGALGLLRVPFAGFSSRSLLG